MRAFFEKVIGDIRRAPLWVWIGLALTVILVYFAWRSSQNAGTSSTTGGGTIPADTGSSGGGAGGLTIPVPPPVPPFTGQGLPQLLDGSGTGGGNGAAGGSTDPGGAGGPNADRHAQVSSGSGGAQAVTRIATDIRSNYIAPRRVATDIRSNRPAPSIAAAASTPAHITADVAQRSPTQLSFTRTRGEPR